MVNQHTWYNMKYMTIKLFDIGGRFSEKACNYI